MSSKPVIAVIGSTGAQGGGLAQAILQDPKHRFALRAITRKIDGSAASALAAQGAEVVAADLDTADSLAKAFAGAHSVFAVTNFWEHFSPERELAQAGNIARAAKQAGVGHVVWSTLEDTRKFIALDDPRFPTLMGRYKVPHYDAKGEADALFEGLPVTYLRTSFYWDNLIHFGMGPRRDESGGLMFLLPTAGAKLPGIAASDIGPATFGLFAQGRAVIGQIVGIAGEHLTGVEMAAELARAIGEPVKHVSIPTADYAKFGFPGAADLANMFQFKQDFEAQYCGIRSVARTRELHPGLQSFRQWLTANARKIPVPAAA
ncbi:MAG: NmrA/HSCARG family protein [Steroidobacteraceae bacterium]